MQANETVAQLDSRTFPFDIHTGWTGAIVSEPACWLSPRFPPLVVRSMHEAVTSPVRTSAENFLQFTPVQTRRPELSWEAFPREQDRRENARLAARIQGVDYDLRVWEVEDGRRGGLVISQVGLPEPVFRPSLPLPAGRQFFWTFRARYTLDGRRYETPWAFSRVPGAANCDADRVPATNYFRFRTP